MFHRQPTIRFNMRPRPRKPVAPKILTAVFFAVSLFVAWKIFAWIAL